MNSGIGAAVEMAHEIGLDVAEPVLIQETNNTVVWLRPHAIIAKVGTRTGSSEALVREFEVATALAGLGAPIAPPLPDSSPVQHDPTGFLVTLWSRLEHNPDLEPDERMVGSSLADIHRALAECGLALPSFRVGLERARVTLFDDFQMMALPSDDLAYLRSAFTDLSAELDSRIWSDQPLHGEPHRGNLLQTPAGIRWIDFETTCRGPLEWDLAFLPAGSRTEYEGKDEAMLELLEGVVSALVATWCWVQARFPEMRLYGSQQLASLRARR